MNNNELQYHLNFRQKDFYDAAREARLARIAQKGQSKPKLFTVFLINAIKLSITVLLVYEFAVLIYG